MNNEDDLFLKQMKGVKPIKKKQQIKCPKKENEK